jgi:eukaryotic-like serine/threonine-protein kinase
MKLLELNDLELVGLIGSGESGKVYLSKDKQGNKFAVKVFEGMSINRALLVKALSRLEEGGWPEGVMKLEKLDLEERPAFSVMPYYGDDGLETGNRSLWNLQDRLDRHPEDDTWNVIRDIADALAEMHRKRVVHGNLKPSNVFFDESGKLQLADWMLGNMPEISRFGFSDAYLHQAPEQLLDASGFHEERGYKWDVFAFGVLAYRLLTRKFPRCDSIFQDVAPQVGEDCDTTIQAELPRIVNGLMKESQITWSVETGHVLEKQYRAWIERCLMLDPALRPSSMIEVSKSFYDADEVYTESLARQELLDQRRNADKSRRNAWFGAGIAAAVALLFLGLWLLVTSWLDAEKADRLTEKQRIQADLKTAEDRKKSAEDQMKLALDAQLQTEERVKREIALGLERLKAMNEISDQLFEWSMEKGRASLPVLDGRETRLGMLDGFYQGFIATHHNNVELANEVATARIHLAEISISLGDAAKAEERLEVAIKGLQEIKPDESMRLRFGRNALLLALLKQRSGKEGLEVDFNRARKALQDIAVSGGDTAQLQQWQAILDFHEAKWLVDKGDETKGLDQLKKATRMMNALSDANPNAAILRSELASIYLSSATIMEGLGKLVDAHETRLLASVEIEKLLKNDNNNFDLLLDLAGCYGAMAEASLLEGEIEIATKHSTDAMGLLDRLLKERPDSKEASMCKGIQLGIKASLLRDQGKSEDAMNALDQGLSILERQEKYPVRDYRLALLQWQKGKMLGYSGKKDDELKLLIQADEALKNMQLSDDGPRAEVFKKSRAYLLGDLAHVLELAKQNDRAEEIYREAMVVWEGLLKLRPKNEEYKSALDWSRQRVSKL